VASYMDLTTAQQFKFVAKSVKRIIYIDKNLSVLIL
jgi:hypothetical protein